ncbi:MAG: hypothetical protein JKY70_19350 [Mucilaginibacter sp.]|nr:hypothetical protein [Mucilaginibacter sp.]
MQKILKPALAVLVTIVAIACSNEEKKKPSADSAAMAKSNTVITMQADTGHLVGAWHDEAIKSEDGKDIAYEVISKGTKVYIQAITFTGKELTLNDAPPITASASEIRKDGDKYVGVNSPAEIYKVDKTGNLLIYDGETLVAICKKIL